MTTEPKADEGCVHSRQRDLWGKRMPCAVPWCKETIPEDKIVVEWVRPPWPGKGPEPAWAKVIAPPKLTITYVRAQQHVARRGLVHVWRRQPQNPRKK